MFIQKSKVKKSTGRYEYPVEQRKGDWIKRDKRRRDPKGASSPFKTPPECNRRRMAYLSRERNRAYRDHLTSKIPKSPHFSTPLRYTLTYPPKRSAKSDEVLKGLPQPPFAIYLTPLVKKRQQRSQKKFTRIS
jgi:hypothetical protein